jgi:hypothetical protein
LEDSPG